MRTFTLVGHGGFYNRGSEAIVLTTAQLLRESFPGCRIILASFRHERDQETGAAHGIEVVPGIDRWWQRSLGHRVAARATRRWSWRRQFRPLWGALEETDAVLSVGGDNFTMDYGYPLYFLQLNALCRQLRRPLAIWAASIGPFPEDARGRRALSNLRAVPLITVRESATLRYLEARGITQNVRPVADPAFLLRPEPVDVSAFWPEGDGVLGLNLSPLVRGAEAQTGLVAEATRLIRKARDRDLGVLLIPHVQGGPPAADDQCILGPLFESVRESCRVSILPSGYSAAQTKAVIARCRFFIGARTHATIAALSSGVPTISIAYSQKAVGLNECLFGDARYVVHAGTLNGGVLGAALDRLIADEHVIKGRLAQASQSWERQARQGVPALSALLSAERAAGDSRRGGAQAEPGYV